MLVILRENVPNLGRTGDVVRVKPGYARNFLIPRNLVAPADEKNLAQLDHQKKLLEKKRLAEMKDAEAIAERLSAHVVSLARKVGANEKLFGSVTAHDIWTDLKEAGFDKIEKSMIQLKDAIKEIGDHEISIKIMGDVEAKIKLSITPEN